MKFINIFGINYKDLKINVLQFDIDTGDAVPIYCNYKQFIKDKLDVAVRAGTIEGLIKELLLKISSMDYKKNPRQMNYKC